MSVIPRISVAIPTCQRASYLQTCLQSVMNQTFLPYEIVVSEDGDDRDTKDLVDSISDQGVIIRHVRNSPALGQLRNRQQAFKLTSGEYVAMLDDDDQWENTFLETTSDALINNPDCGFCSTDHFIMTESGEISLYESEAASNRWGRSSMKSGIYRDVLARTLDVGPFSLQHTLFRRSSLESIDFFQPYGKNVPDLALFMKLGAVRTAAYYIPQKLGRYRVHGGQQTTKRVENAESKVECLSQFYEHHSTCIDRNEKKLITTLYRTSVLELAVAYAHLSDRARALKALTRLFDLGFGVPALKRVSVLAALLMGVRQ